MNTSFICQHFGKNTQFKIGEENSGFCNRSYSDVSGKYQNMEKPLKHQRRLGLHEWGYTYKIKNISAAFSHIDY